MNERDEERVGELLQRGLGHLTDAIGAAEAGIVVAPPPPASELEAELGLGPLDLSAPETAQLWARAGDTLRAVDPGSYRLLLGIAVAIAALHGTEPVT